MKTKIYSLKTFITALVLTVAFSGCKKDLCETTSCLNGATCNEGTCECAVGYEGENCGTEMRQKFLGLYTGTMTVAGQTGNYQVEINASSQGADKVNIVLVLDNHTYKGEVVNGNSVNIPQQLVYTQQGTYTVEGSGNLNGSQLILNWNATDQGQSLTYNFSGTK